MVRSNKKLNFTPPFEAGTALLVKTWNTSTSATENDADIIDIYNTSFYDTSNPYSYTVLINVEGYQALYFVDGNSPNMILIGDYGTSVQISAMSGSPLITLSNYLSDVGENPRFISFGGGSNTTETRNLGSLNLVQ